MAQYMYLVPLEMSVARAFAVYFTAFALVSIGTTYKTIIRQYIDMLYIVLVSRGNLSCTNRVIRT